MVILTIGPEEECQGNAFGYVCMYMYVRMAVRTCNLKTITSRRQTCAMMKTCVIKGKTVCFYIAQYPARWTAQSASHVLPSLADMFIPTPTRLLLEAV